MGDFRASTVEVSSQLAGEHSSEILYGKKVAATTTSVLRNKINAFKYNNNIQIYKKYNTNKLTSEKKDLEDAGDGFK